MFKPGVAAACAEARLSVLPGSMLRDVQLAADNSNLHLLVLPRLMETASHAPG